MDNESTALPQPEATIPKPEEVKITQIQSLRGDGPNIFVYGLGDDQKLYMWSGIEHRWILV